MYNWVMSDFPYGCHIELSISILLYSVRILKVWIQSSKRNFCRWLDPIQRLRTLGFAATVVPTLSTLVQKYLHSPTTLHRNRAAHSAGDPSKPRRAMCHRRMGRAFHLDHPTMWVALCYKKYGTTHYWGQSEAHSWTSRCRVWLEAGLNPRTVHSIALLPAWISYRSTHI
jgi:hypothetical protein